MENFFQKYLCQHPKASPPKPSSSSSKRNPPGTEVKPPSFPHDVSPPSLSQPSSPAPLVLPHESPQEHETRAREEAGSPHPSSPRLLMESESDGEEEARAARVPCGSPTGALQHHRGLLEPALQRRRVEATLHSEEDDDLHLLLGSQEARRQRHEALEERHQHIDTAAQLRDGAASAGRREDGRTSPTFRLGRQAFPAALPKPEPISRLPWQSHSSQDLRRITRYFALQLETEIAANESLFHAFTPFLKSRFIEKVVRSRSVFSPHSAACAAALPHPLSLPLESYDDSDSETNPYVHRIPPFPVFQPAPALTHEIANPPVSEAATSVFTLRPYQLHGVSYLLDHFHRGLSCILSDDMGLGKTAQISSFLHVLHRLHGIPGPHLVICPLTTLTNWMRELARWAPELKLAKYHGGRAERSRQAMDRHPGVLVTSTNLLNQDRSFFLKRSWATVIVDEAHVLKNQGTRITAVSRKLKAAFRVAVTGTPVQNDPREVWSILGFLFPTVTSRDGGFDDDDPAEAATACAAVLTHLMLRRTKGQLLLGIPPRTDHPVTMLEPTGLQSELLSVMVSGALEGGSGGMQGHLTHQRMVCSHPLSLKITAGESARSAVGDAFGDGIVKRLEAAGIPLTEEAIIQSSAKMRYLDAELPRLKAEGHRCLIFSNFSSIVDLLEGMCVLRGYSYERLDGSCNRVERELSLLRFNNPKSKCFLFLSTTSAGGVGITLTGADTVFLYDANFNPQLDRQAADRVHRIGQTREVHVYRLCLRHTLEEHIHEVSEFKASLGDLIVEAGGGASEGSSSSSSSNSLSAVEIKKLFQKLMAAREKRLEATAGGGALPLHANLESEQPSATTFQPLWSKDGALVRELMRIATGDGDTGRHSSAKQRQRVFREVVHSRHCFVCGEIMRPLEPMYNCLTCPKVYHADCVGERTPKPGHATPRQWTCPRHHCLACGKASQADGVMFLCWRCPRSFCFDCLPPFFMELDAKGETLCHVSRTYDGMAEEQVAVSRQSYYLECLRCRGVESATDDSSDTEEESSSSRNASDEESEVEEVA